MSSGPDASSDHDKRCLTLLCSEISINEPVLLRIVESALQGLVLRAPDALELIERLLWKAAERGAVQLQSASLVSLLFELCKHSAPALHQVSEEHGQKPMAHVHQYWKACLVILTLACCNVEIIGQLCWNEAPTLRALMECMITNSWR